MADSRRPSVAASAAAAAAAAVAVPAGQQTGAAPFSPAATFSLSFSLAEVLGDPLQTSEWSADGLPKDQLSVENALMLQTARRWPLLIDPQGQMLLTARTGELHLLSYIFLVTSSLWENGYRLPVCRTNC
ncbi:hypothetical protein T492DRAFT_848444 [Pavlovales sp. CCMP2436]|nr:hypothetical protein T492DRAFT_848444 [Pavlovales sp. CCMP2436]